LRLACALFLLLPAFFRFGLVMYRKLNRVSRIVAGGA
jgi:hypothetical protein